MQKPKVTAILVAAGKGTRMGANINKQYIELQKKPIIAHTLGVFQQAPLIDKIILVVGEKEIDFCKKNIVDKYDINKVSAIVKGGKERTDSVYNGLRAIDEACDVVVIHDGARPFVTEGMLAAAISTAKDMGAAIIGVPVKDTIKVINEDMQVANTPAREFLWAIQTPQAFNFSLLKGAYEQRAQFHGLTDDAMLLEKLGYPVKVLMGSYENIKITTPDDLLLAQEILKKGENQ